MADYAKLDKHIDALDDTIWDMASKVWDFAELGFEEEKSSAYESAELEKNGFKISDRGIGGIDTSWIASWGSGSPVLGALVEFDALPGLGNDTVPKKESAKNGNTNGHRCGHNLIGSGAIGAAIALKAHMEEEKSAVGGKMDLEHRHHFDCVIHSTMEHFGIEDKHETGC